MRKPQTTRNPEVSSDAANVGKESSILKATPGKQGRGASLYIHVPFCSQKCSYCHFYVIPNKSNFHTLLMEGLRREWKLRRGLLKDLCIESIYLGGGTPALLGAEQIRSILDMIRSDVHLAADCEITVEANPENIDSESFKALADLGINRLSIGIQSFDDALLHKLGRTHSGEAARVAVETAASVGFDNISIDLMYDLPGQTIEHWKHSLDIACQLPIQHLSLYNLTIEPQTVFFKHRQSIRSAMPGEDLSLEMYDSAIEQFKQNGLMQYEISAFARNGKLSHHNTGYWRGRPFLGLGPSAFSYWDSRRFRNYAHIHRYARALEEGTLPVDFEEELEPAAARRELLIIGLRLREGLNLDRFQKEHGPLDADVFTTLERHIELNFVERTGDHIRLSHAGVFVYDSLAAELV